MEIRIASENDVSSIIQLIINRMEWMDETGLKEWNSNGYLEYYTEDYFKNNIESFYVAEEDHQIVGAMCLYTSDERWQDDKECYYVHHLVSDVHHKGLGKLLLLYADILSYKKGYDVIRLDSSTYDEKLTNMYSSLNYKPVYNFIEGNYHGTTREKRIGCQYDAIIYDLDGTMVNTFDMNFYPLLQIIEEEKGMKLSIDDVKKYASYDGKRTLKDLEIENIEEVYKRWVEYVNSYPTKAMPFDYMQFILDHMPIVQGVVSSKRNAQYQIDIVSQGLDTHISSKVLAEDTPLHKPNKEPLELCCKRLGVEVSKVLYIGDTYSDYLTCKNAGCDFGYALYGNVNKEIIEEATYVFHTPMEILKIFSE